MPFTERRTAARKMEWPVQIQPGGIWLSQEEKPERQPGGESYLTKHGTKEKWEQILHISAVRSTSCLTHPLLRISVHTFFQKTSI